MIKIKMDLDGEKEIIMKEVGIINERGLSPVQVYILCKASKDEHFQYRFDNFMRYLEVFGRIECEQEDKIDLMCHLISLNFGNFDDVIQNLIKVKGLDPKSVSTILKKEFIRPSNQPERVEIQRETPGNYNQFEVYQIANSSQSTLLPSELGSQERNIRMNSLGLNRDVITQGGPENRAITTYEEHQSLSRSQAQPIEDEQLTDRQHPTSSPAFDQKLRLQALRNPSCIFCNTVIMTSQDYARFSRCNHDLHTGCLINALNYILSQGLVEMKCSCNIEISETDLMKYLPKSDYLKLDEIRIRKFLEEDQFEIKADSLLTCNKCGLKVGINKSDSYGICHCGAKYCSECHQEFNEGHKCPSKKPEQVCDHSGYHNKSAGIGILACNKCNAPLCRRCNKTITTCVCYKKK